MIVLINLSNEGFKRYSFILFQVSIKFSLMSVMVKIEVRLYNESWHVLDELDVCIGIISNRFSVDNIATAESIAGKNSPVVDEMRVEYNTIQDKTI